MDINKDKKRRKRLGEPPITEADTLQAVADAKKYGLNPNVYELEKRVIESRRAARLKALGERVQEARRRAGFKSQVGFAKKMGEPGRGSLKNIESAGADLDTGELAWLAQKLEVTSDWLIGISNEPSNDPAIQDIADKYGLNEKSLRFLRMLRKNEKEFILKKDHLLPDGIDRQPLWALNTILSSGMEGKRLLEAICRILFSGDESVELTTERKTISHDGHSIEMGHSKHIDAAHMRKIELVAVGENLEAIRKRLWRTDKEQKALEEKRLAEIQRARVIAESTERALKPQVEEFMKRERARVANLQKDEKSAPKGKGV